MRAFFCEVPLFVLTAYLPKEEQYDLLCVFICMHGYEGVSISMYEYVWVCMDMLGMYGYVWIYFAMYGYVWVFMGKHHTGPPHLLNNTLNPPAKHHTELEPPTH